MTKVLAIMVLTAILAVGYAWRARADDGAKPGKKPTPGCDTMCKVPHQKTARSDFPVRHTDVRWHELLTPEQFAILREKDTEPAFSGAYWNNHQPGVYRCAGCGAMLFSSKTKFDSGTGWPSFYEPVGPKVLFTQTDMALGMVRTEVLCARCGGHLGHVFHDGPAPTGLRYCINSAALVFEKAQARR